MKTFRETLQMTIDIIQGKWPEVDYDSIKVLGEVKK